MIQPKRKIVSLIGLAAGLFVGGVAGLVQESWVPVVILPFFGFIAPILSWRWAPPADLAQKKQA